MQSLVIAFLARWRIHRQTAIELTGIPWKSQRMATKNLKDIHESVKNSRQKFFKNAKWEWVAP